MYSRALWMNSDLHIFRRFEGIFSFVWLTLTVLIRTLGKTMPRKCVKTGKKTTAGQNRSHSLRATKRTFKPNIQTKRVYDPNTGEYKRIKVSAAYLRTLAKRLQEGKKVQ